MGYYSRLHGSWSVTPALPWSVIQDHVPGPDDVVGFEIETEEVETEDGTLIRKSAREITDQVGDQRKMYDLNVDLLKLAVVAHEAGSVVLGTFIREGEEQGDVERYWVEVDGRMAHPKPTVRSERAKLTWPDGTTTGPGEW